MPINAKALASFIERAGKRIPDPVIIFMAFYPAAFLLTVVMSGHSFETLGTGGETVTHQINGMHQAEHVRWIFDNALLANWLGFGGGVLGVILVVMLAVGVAENSGLFGALIKRAGSHLPQSILPLLLIFLGIMSSMATDAGYLVLIPLAGLLYAGLNRNPLIGMAAAFAGVSAGFSANLLPGPVDAIIGQNAQAFAEAQGVPFVSATGQALTPETMHWFFIIASTFVLSATGYWVTRRFVEPRLDREDFVVPTEINPGEFQVSNLERKGLRAAGLGTLVALLMIAGLAFGPLASFTNEAGDPVRPYIDNMILLISLFFVVTGAFFGVAVGKFRSVMDVVKAMVGQMNTMGYVLVLTFFTYNFLGLLNYSGLGTWITFLGAEFLQALGLQKFPILLLVGFILVTAVINIFIGGLTSKWMLLGPIFVPMLYVVNPAMTPDLVAAAFRVADSSTNIITPMMTYAGVILAFMRKYRPDMAFGDMLLIMLPYSVAFLTIWTLLLVGFFALGIPLGI
ncbi:AbgT family transporter [Wenzhouxiangella marina]|uniref:Putative p-aminobenzoyl-glutamate transporter n=1 Tax=Wenzhouxiangella marina TaxID=1579979 RepID=A0A0K0XVT8_9GAMM|nr:AbgT family transporter [Wenzhouxiangella marina]AKS41731.1 Putative p-aminobenzoyl-glutamate transporter [Wenzhouxiangella marina]MBB6086507.1 aminobenzoyl-glutamate transport protein [Wenzhouxiangella marina]